MAETAARAVHGVVTEPILRAWGRGVGEAAASGALRLPLTLALRGSLGVGKSVLARAVARGAGVAGPMPSPTYNLLFTYEAPARASAGEASPPSEPLVIHHLDLYRLDDPDDVWELGWQELGEGRELVLIEWPERAEALLPANRWEIRLAFPDDPEAADLRTFQAEAVGDVPDLAALASPGPPSPAAGSEVDGDAIVDSGEGVAG